MDEVELEGQTALEFNTLPSPKSGCYHLLRLGRSNPGLKGSSIKQEIAAGYFPNFIQGFLL